MRKVVLLEHVSLDGFVAGPKGEMDWIKLADDDAAQLGQHGAELWQRVTELCNAADAALYGRVTYQMMESYWPTAADKPDATEHDKDHSRWLSTATKFVFSNTLKSSDWAGTRILSGDLKQTIDQIKQEPGSDIVLLGSPSLVRSMDSLGLIDDYWLFLNPTVLGEGLPLFEKRHELKPVSSRQLSTGVIELHYQR